MFVRYKVSFEVNISDIVIVKYSVCTLPEMKYTRLPCTADIRMQIDTARHMLDVKNAQ